MNALLLEREVQRLILTDEDLLKSALLVQNEDIVEAYRTMLRDELSKFIIHESLDLVSNNALYLLQNRESLEVQIKT